MIVEMREAIKRILPWIPNTENKHSENCNAAVNLRQALAATPDDCRRKLLAEGMRMAERLISECGGHEAEATMCIRIAETADRTERGEG